MHKHTKRDRNTKSHRLLHTPAPTLKRVTPSSPHNTQHTSLFGARCLRQRLRLLPRCLLLLRLLSRCCLFPSLLCSSILFRILLCFCFCRSLGLCLCFCFSRSFCFSSRLCNAPTSQLQSQVSCSVLQFLTGCTEASLVGKTKQGSLPF
jgi:hypothetical protein